VGFVFLLNQTCSRCFPIPQFADILRAGISFRPKAVMSEKLQTAEGMLSFLNLIVLALLVWKFQTRHLRSVYPALFWCITAEAVAAAALLFVPWRSNLYALLYFASEGVIVALSMMVVYEVYRIALSPLPAISAICRKAIVIVFPCTAAVALFSAVLDSKILPNQSRIVHRFFTVERILDINILFFLLGITALMLWFPLVMRRNLVLYIAGFVVHFLGRSCGLLLANVLPQQHLRSVSNSLMAISLVCCILWLAGLRREDEDQTAVTGHRWNPAAMEDLTAQLSQINSALARLVR
jgi:hypothetical protein